MRKLCTKEGLSLAQTRPQVWRFWDKSMTDGMCDNCDDKEATRARVVDGVKSEICDTCYLRYIMSKPLEKSKK